MAGALRAQRTDFEDIIRRERDDGCLCFYCKEQYGHLIADCPKRQVAASLAVQAESENPATDSVKAADASACLVVTRDGRHGRCARCRGLHLPGALPEPRYANGVDSNKV